MPRLTTASSPRLLPALHLIATARATWGNVRNDEEFFEHFCILVAELRRVMKPGHNVSFHAC